MRRAWIAPANRHRNFALLHRYGDRGQPGGVAGLYRRTQCRIVTHHCAVQELIDVLWGWFFDHFAHGTGPTLFTQYR
jgi:hypothetical protein